MNDFLKQKFHRKLYNLLRFKRNGRLRSSITFTKKKIDLNPVLVYKQHSRFFFLKHLDFSSFFFEPSLSSSLSSSFPISSTSYNLKIINNNPSYNTVDNSLLVYNPQLIEKKKYHINSFLFSSLCHFSRKRPVRFFDTDVLRTYFTIPYRFSLTRSPTYRVIFRYYSTLRIRYLSSLRKNILSRALDSSYSTGHKRSFVQKFILSLEKRLDSSLLRLSHSKSLYTLKRSSLDHRSSPRFRKVKSPWKNYSILQIKQQLNHGHYLINGKKVTSGGIELTLFDTLSFSSGSSFLSNPFLFDSSFFFFQLSSVNSRSSSSHSVLFRHLYSLSSDFSFWHSFFNSPVLSEINFLCQHLKTFHIKRFTEIFLLSYKNFHLFSRVSSSSPSLLETLIKPFVSSLSSGSNQSLSFLWPLLSLLSFISWGPSLQRTLLRPSAFSKTGTNNNKLYNKNSISNSLLQKNLHDLFISKKFQTQFFSSSEGSPLSSSLSSSSPSTNLLSHFLVFSSIHPSLFSVKSLFRYASVLHGTRKCKRVCLQQRRSSFFFRNFYNKIHFFELELDFSQLSFRLSSF